MGTVPHDPDAYLAAHAPELCRMLRGGGGGDGHDRAGTVMVFGVDRDNDPTLLACGGRVTQTGFDAWLDAVLRRGLDEPLVFEALRNRNTCGAAARRRPQNGVDNYPVRMADLWRRDQRGYRYSCAADVTRVLSHADVDWEGGRLVFMWAEPPGGAARTGRTVVCAFSRFEDPAGAALVAAAKRVAGTLPGSEIRMYPSTHARVSDTRRLEDDGELLVYPGVFDGNPLGNKSVFCVLASSQIVIDLERQHNHNRSERGVSP